MSVLPKEPVSYANRDFQSIRLRLISHLQQAFPDLVITADDVAPPEVILLEGLAFVGDVVNYAMDGVAREGRITTAERLKSVLAHARSLGYTPQGRAAATATLTLTLGAIPTADVTIPAETVVRTNSVGVPIRFRTLASVTILAGSDPPTADVEAEHAELQRLVAAGGGVPGRKLTLPASPYVSDTLTVEADQGAFTLVEDFAESTGADLHVVLDVDEEGRATLEFGDGRAGVPPDGTLLITYKTGGGEGGNVEAGSLTRFDTTFVDAQGRTVSVSVTNAAKAAGGFDAQGIESIRRLAPATLRSPGRRSVTASDMEVAALRIAGVARAQLLAFDVDPTIDINSGHLLIVPDGGGLPTQELKDQVKASILADRPPPLTFELIVRDPILTEVPIEARVTLDPGADPATVKNNVTAALNAFFSLTDADGAPNANVDFGGRLSEISWSDIFNVIRDAAGVRKMAPTALKVGGLLGDVPLDVRAFPALGTITLIDVATGDPL